MNESNILGVYVERINIVVDHGFFHFLILDLSVVLPSVFNVLFNMTVPYLKKNHFHRHPLLC